MPIDTEIDTEDKSYIKCPYCGNKVPDSWDRDSYSNNETIIEVCDSCWKEFKIEITLEISYSTTKLEE